MKMLTNELRELVREYSLKFNSIAEQEFSAKPPGKWSKKEILGHLIDSAHNNLRRLICAQYEPTPPKIVYDQNFWVSANAYSSTSREDIIQLWRLINERYIDIIDNMPEENYSCLCDTGKLNTELHPLSWLAEDYIKHMKHHINQILDGSFPISYS